MDKREIESMRAVMQVRRTQTFHSWKNPPDMLGRVVESEHEAMRSFMNARTNRPEVDDKKPASHEGSWFHSFTSPGERINPALNAHKAVTVFKYIPGENGYRSEEEVVASGVKPMDYALTNI
jgi:hypothetical protein